MAAKRILFHVSDLHFGREDRAALDWFAAAVAQERPDAVICTGDLTWRGTAKEFAAATRWFGGLGVPVRIEPGNHDIPYYWNPLARAVRPYALFDKLCDAVHDPLDLPDVSVISLKTVARAQWRLNWSKGRVRPQDLRLAVGSVNSSGLNLVTCHHPLVDADTYSTGSTRGGKAALAALAKAGTTAVLSGHVHDAFDLSVETSGGSIRMIGAGTLSERLRATRPSYNRLEWTAQAGLTVSVHTL